MCLGWEEATGRVGCDTRSSFKGAQINQNKELTGNCGWNPQREINSCSENELQVWGKLGKRRTDVDKLPCSKITPSNKIVPLILRHWNCLEGLFLLFFKGVADFNLQSHEIKVCLQLNFPGDLFLFNLFIF